MKKTLTLALAVLLTASATINASASTVLSTNLDGISVGPAYLVEEDSSRITGGGTIYWSEESTDDVYWRDSDETPLAFQADEALIFINGSLLSEFAVSGDIVYLPLRAVAVALGAEVEWLPAQQQVAITDSENEVLLAVGSTQAYYNEAQITLDTSPQILRYDRVYIAISDVEKLFCTTPMLEDEETYYIGSAYPLYNTAVMIDRYPEGSAALSEDEARAIAREQLIIAFELKYGEFVEWDAEAGDYEWSIDDPDPDSDKNFLRWKISTLDTLGENGRFFKFDVAYEFWVDKYTGEVLTCYRGLALTFQLFDPYASGALGFAG